MRPRPARTSARAFSTSGSGGHWDATESRREKFRVCSTDDSGQAQHTLTNGHVAPHPVGRAHDRLDGLSAGKAESGVALIRGHSLEAHIGGGDGEAVVDLRHGAAVDLLTGGDVRARPVATYGRRQRDRRRVSTWFEVVVIHTVLPGMQSVTISWTPVAKI